MGRSGFAQERFGFGTVWLAIGCLDRWKEAYAAFLFFSM